MKSIGIDIGTTSISAVLMDAADDRVIRSWTIENPGFLPACQPWERLQDPRAIVVAAKGLLNEILAGAEDVGVIGLTGQMHGIVYLDENGAPMSPLMTWQDGRGNQPVQGGASLCELIGEKYGVKAYSGYGLVTHLYNLKTGLVPEGAAAVATIMDYFGMALTGAMRPLLHSSNAAALGLYDLQTQAWRADILADFGEAGDVLPRVANEFELVGHYQGIPVSVAIGDNQASFIGSVEHANDEILVNMGTGGQISLLSRDILKAEDIETRPFNADSYLVVGASLCGGRAYAVLADFFAACARDFGVQKPDVYGVMAKWLRAPELPDPMVVDTRFAGTREHPKLRGGITNLSPENLTPAGLTRGVLEGMAQELLGLYHTMVAGLGVTRTRIVASGNGMRRNEALRRITAEAFGMELRLSALTEEAACGAALAGLAAIGERTWQETIGFAAGAGGARGQ